MHAGVTSLKTRLNQLPTTKPSPDLVRRDPELGLSDPLPLTSRRSEPEEDPSQPNSSDSEEEGDDMLSPLPAGGNSIQMYQFNNHNHNHQNNANRFHPHSLSIHSAPGESNRKRVASESDSVDLGEHDHNHDKVDPVTGGHRTHFGSFYLRIGAVAFGIGSMIYSGLEFGQYFELDPVSEIAICNFQFAREFAN